MSTPAQAGHAHAENTGHVPVVPIILSMLVRVVVVSAALSGYYAAVPFVFPDDGGGANIGAGLIAFAALMVISLGWAILDGREHGPLPTLVCWAIVSVVIAIGWLVIRGLVESDATMSAAELIGSDVFSLFFTSGLVLVSSALGAAMRSPATCRAESLIRTTRPAPARATSACVRSPRHTR